MNLDALVMSDTDRMVDMVDQFAEDFCRTYAITPERSLGPITRVFLAAATDSRFDARGDDKWTFRLLRRRLNQCSKNLRPEHFDEKYDLEDLRRGQLRARPAL